ncbi:MAG: NUDIX domain-containing protein [Nanoarchaeota archaeon]|nr:NUDIX domain-containing protein [Nanoarchaeota archaeon]MBU4085971.1 NUDIX domain-containing protein [Nanoarchaeota archaeon]
MNKELHYKLAGIIIRDRKLLMCRKYDELHFIMPGGKRLKGETARRTLERELMEELGVKLTSARKFKTWEAPHFRDKNTIVRMETYFVEIDGEPEAKSEINELQWVDSHYKENGLRVASIDEDYLIPELKKRQLID